MHWRNVLRYARSDATEWKVTEVHQERVTLTTQRQNHSVDELKRWRLPTQGRIEMQCGWVLLQ